MSARRSQEGLEVSPFQHPIPQGPQSEGGYYGLKTPHSETQESQSAGYGYDAKGPLSNMVSSAEANRKRSRRRIIILIVLVVVLTAAIIGGAVGGTLGRKKNSGPTISRPAPSPADSRNSGGILPTSSDPSLCHGGICPTILQTITWPKKQFIFGLSASKSAIYKSGDGTSWDANWTDLGGTFIYPPTVVSWGDGRIDIMGVATDKGMYWKTFDNNAWDSKWTSIGGIFTSAPSAACWGPQRIDLFGKGTDGALWHNYWGEQGAQRWGGWESLSGTIVGPPTVAAWGNRRLDIFVRGTDNALWHIYWDGVWHSWESLGGVLVSDPVVVSSAANFLDIFVLGQGNTMCWKGYHNAWLPWQCQSDKSFESMPVPVVIKSDRVDVLGVGSDDHLYHKSLAGSNWSSNWDDLGGPVNSCPAGILFSGGSSQAAIFGVGMNGELFTGNVSSISYSWGSSGWKSLGGQFASVL